MPIRFSTQAANADFLRDDAEPAGASEGMPQDVSAGGTPRKPFERMPGREGRPPTEAKGEGKPSKDADKP